MRKEQKNIYFKKRFKLYIKTRTRSRKKKKGRREVTKKKYRSSSVKNIINKKNSFFFGNIQTKQTCVVV